MKSKEQYFLLSEPECFEQMDRVHVTFIKDCTHTGSMRDPKPESYSQRVHKRKVHDWYMREFGHCIHCQLGLRIIENDEKVEII